MSDENFGEYVGGENEPEYVPSQELPAVGDEAAKLFEDSLAIEIVDADQTSEGDLNWLRAPDWNLDPQDAFLPFNGDAEMFVDDAAGLYGEAAAFGGDAAAPDGDTQHGGEIPPDESQLIDL